MKIFYHKELRIAAVCRGILADEVRDDYQYSGHNKLLAEIKAISETDINCSLEQLNERMNDLTGQIDILFDNETGKFSLVREESDSENDGKSHQTLYSLISTETTMMTEEDKVEYPFFCSLNREADGRLVGRIEYKSDWDGCFDKLAFPDRSWKDAIEGICWVKIVKDLPGYAFVTGSYAIKGTPASIDDVIQKLWDDIRDGRINRGLRIFEVKDSLLGSFIGTADDYGHIYAFMSENDSVIRKSVCPDTRTEMLKNISEHIEWKLSAEDLIVQYSLDEYDSADDLFARFKLSAYSGDDPEGKQLGWWQTAPTLGSHASTIAHEACEMGILTRKDLISQGRSIATAIAVDRDDVFMLASFANDDVEELIDYVNKTNAEADERVLNAARKGKITIKA